MILSYRDVVGTLVLGGLIVTIGAIAAKVVYRAFRRKQEYENESKRVEQKQTSQNEFDFKAIQDQKIQELHEKIVSNREKLVELAKEYCDYKMEYENSRKHIPYVFADNSSDYDMPIGDSRANFEEYLRAMEYRVHGKHILHRNDYDQVRQRMVEKLECCFRSDESNPMTHLDHTVLKVLFLEWLYEEYTRILDTLFAHISSEFCAVEAHGELQNILTRFGDYNHLNPIESLWS